MKTSLKYVLFSVLFFVLMSCDSNQVFDSYTSVGKSWNKDNVVSFEFEAKDTLAEYNMFLNLRANNDYPFSNIFLITSIESPNATIKVDTLEYIMAAPDGRMLGNGFSDIKESKLWYKANYRFTEIGVHSIKIEQAQRARGKTEGIEELEGILDVGFRIEKVK